MGPAGSAMVPVPARARLDLILRRDGEPLLCAMPQRQVVRADEPPIRVGTHPGSTAWTSTSGQRRAIPIANAVT